MIHLFTDRLELREFRADDIDAYARICADPAVMRYLHSGPLSCLEAWRQMAMFVGHWQLRGYGMFAAVERATGDLIGRIGFLNPEGWPGFELGWTLDRRVWGLGYATEGARAALQYAFHVLDQPHVISLIHPDNAPSLRVSSRLGQTREGEAEVFGIPVGVYGIHRGGGRAA